VIHHRRLKMKLSQINTRTPKWFDDREHHRTVRRGTLRELKHSEVEWDLGSGSKLPEDPDPGMCLVRSGYDGEEITARECSRIDFCSLCSIGRSKMSYYLRGGSPQSNNVHRFTPQTFFLHK